MGGFRDVFRMLWHWWDAPTSTPLPTPYIDFAGEFEGPIDFTGEFAGPIDFGGDQ